MELTVTQADNDLAHAARKYQSVCSSCPVAQAFRRINYNVKVSPMCATIEESGRFIEFSDELYHAIMKYDATSAPIIGTFEVNPSPVFLEDLYKV